MHLDRGRDVVCSFTSPSNAPRHISQTSPRSTLLICSGLSGFPNIKILMRRRVCRTLKELHETINGLAALELLSIGYASVLFWAADELTKLATSFFPYSTYNESSYPICHQKIPRNNGEGYPFHLRWSDISGAGGFVNHISFEPPSVFSLRKSRTPYYPRVLIWIVERCTFW